MTYEIAYACLLSKMMTLQISVTLQNAIIKSSESNVLHASHMAIVVHLALSMQQDETSLMASMKQIQVKGVQRGQQSTSFNTLKAFTTNVIHKRVFCVRSRKCKCVVKPATTQHSKLVWFVT